MPNLVTTIAFSDDPLVARVSVIRSVHLAELRAAVNAVRALAGLSAAAFTDSTIVRAVQITELRTALDAALSALKVDPNQPAVKELLRLYRSYLTERTGPAGETCGTPVEQVFAPSLAEYERHRAPMAEATSRGR